MTAPIRFSNSAYFSGRLSLAEGRRKPYSTRVFLREASPPYIPLSCGKVTWDSSMIVRKQSFWWLAFLLAGEMAGIIFYPTAVAYLLDHSQIIISPAFYALRLEELAFLFKFFQLQIQFFFNFD